MQVVYLGVIQDMSAGKRVSVTKKERKPMQGELMSGIWCRKPGLSLTEGLREMVWKVPEACPTLKARKWGIALSVCSSIYQLMGIWLFPALGYYKKKLF